jgi:hypothetical protein
MREDEMIQTPGVWLRSGIAGVVGIVCYILAITIPWPKTQAGTSVTLVIVSAWPILSIIYAYGLCSYIASERDSAVNRLAFVFAVTAFATVLAMIVVQLAIGAAIQDIANGLDELTANALRRGLRMVDIGLDVAWDMLIGTALILSGTAMRQRTGLRLPWAIQSVLLGLALICLNAATFPWPPVERGLFDIGPLIGLFVMALAARLAVLGWRSKG